MPRQRLVVRLFRENLGLKVISILASLALFAAVRGSGDAQRTISVEVSTIPPAASSGRILLTDIPDTVRVTLSGRSALLNRLSREPLPPVQIDLRDTSRRFYAIDLGTFTLPPGVSAVQVSPASIDLEWAERAEKRVPVVATLAGRAGDGLEVRRPIRIEPPNVLVVGPAAEIRRIQQVATEAIDVSALALGAHSVPVPLERQRAHVAYADEAQVITRFDIVPESEERVLRHLLVAAVGGGRAELRPARVDVVLRGPRALIRAIDEDQVLPTVDLSALAQGSGSSLHPVHVRGLPDAVEVVRTNPPEVLVDF